MSILIKGMEMPKEGGEICIFADGSIWVNEWSMRRYMRLENAKAIPVPPHGDLIDRGALLDAMFKLVDEETFMAFQQAVNDAPTVIEAEGE